MKLYNLIMIIILILSLQITNCFANEQKDFISAIKEEYQLTRNKNLKIKEKLLSLAGHLSVNEKENQTLYNLVKKLCEKLKMPVPYITIFKGNFINNSVSFISGIDFRTNALALSIIKRLGWIMIGEDLINNLTSEELSTIIAHELCHIKFYHTLKRIGFLLSSKVIRSFLEKKLNYQAFKVALYNNNADLYDRIKSISSTILNFIENIALYKYIRIQEEDADLGGLAVTNNAHDFINSLDKINKLFDKREEKSLRGRFNKLFHSHPSLLDRTEYLNREYLKRNL